MSKASRLWKQKWKNSVDGNIYLMINGEPRKVISMYENIKLNQSKKEYMIFRRQCGKIIKKERKCLN